MKTKYILLFSLVFYLMAMPSTSAELDTSKVGVKVGDIKFYYLSDYIEDGIWNQDYKLVETSNEMPDEPVTVRQGEKLNVEVAEIVNSEITYNITANWIWGFTPGNLDDFGGWMVIKDWDYWLDVNNINLDKPYLDEYGADYEYSFVESAKILGRNYIYEMRLKIPDIKLEVYYRISYATRDGSLENYIFEYQTLFGKAQYMKDKVRLRYTGKTHTDRTTSTEEAPGFIFPVTLVSVMTVIVIKKRNQIKYN